MALHKKKNSEHPFFSQQNLHTTNNTYLLPKGFKFEQKKVLFFTF